MAFLSTPSARRATAPGCSDRWRYPHFYPRPPRGGRRSWIWTSRPTQAFLSTPSARRATGLPAGLLAGPGISIHALREEGDTRARGNRCDVAHFYPRPPRGGRPEPDGPEPPADQISIHALREEGDVQHHVPWIRPSISIHALREEGDRFLGRLFGCRGRFLSTPSARRATYNRL